MNITYKDSIEQPNKMKITYSTSNSVSGNVTYKELETVQPQRIIYKQSSEPEKETTHVEYKPATDPDVIVNGSNIFDAGVLRYDVSQDLTEEEQERARLNIGITGSDADISKIKRDVENLQLENQQQAADIAANTANIAIVNDKVDYNTEKIEVLVNEYAGLEEQVQKNTHTLDVLDITKTIIEPGRARIVLVKQ